MDPEQLRFDLLPEFGNTPSSGPSDDNRNDDLSALDEMFAASRQYQNSQTYLGMLDFIARLPRYSPFNCTLLYTQNPAISYVATAGRWRKEFGRYPKRDARPLVILAPRSPVLFVYDLKDTEGKPVPNRLLHPFETEGSISGEVYGNTIHNCHVHGIDVKDVILAHEHAGSAMPLTRWARTYYADLNIAPSMRYLVLLNKEYSLEDKYSSLAHELAHIFCGHVGIDDKAWWSPRENGGREVAEIEAESVSYLVCLRKRLLASSASYLSNYQTGQAKEMPFFSFDAVIQATTYIEQMGQSKWEKPKKQPPRKRGDDKK